MKSNLKLLAGLVIVFVVASLVWAQATRPASERPLPDQAPAPAQPEEKKPAVVSDAAKAVLDDLRSAYAKLDTLEMTGKVSLNLDAAGQKEDRASEFTASFQAPGKYRHEMKDDMLIVSNTEKAYVYKPDEKKYVSVDAIKERTESSDLPEPVGAMLSQQNPSLLLAIAKDPAAELIESAATVDRDADVTIDGTGYQVLAMKGNGLLTNVMVNPQTHLIRQVTMDLKDRLVQRGVPQVNAATLKIDYTRSVSGGAAAATAFDWTPPTDAMLVKLAADAGPGGGGEENAPSMALVGKPSPDFNLKDLTGKNVTLASQKGKVVIIDFWATWCPPCVEGLPHLDALYKEMSGKGVQALAIDQRETKAQAQKFVDDHKLSLTVLLDTDGAVGDAYKVTGIPQTVVVGKDGSVKKVFIGFGPGSEDKLRQAVEAAIKE